MGYGYKIEKLCCESQGQEIYGVAHIPEKEGRLPLVVFVHQLGATHAAGADYAASLVAQGIAVYTFDLPGGSVDSLSDGKTTEMSIMTEADDLEAVMEAACTWDFVDSEKIVLLGASQGGVVSAVVAARSGRRPAGLILLYPAFMIFDMIHARFGTLEAVPQRFCFLDWIDVGRKYAADIWDRDIYGMIEKYEGPVLLIHGGKDKITDLSYSQRAAGVYQEARLQVIGRAGHGFYGRSFRESVGYIMDYLEQVLRMDLS